MTSLASSLTATDFGTFGQASSLFKAGSDAAAKFDTLSKFYAVSFSANDVASKKVVAQSNSGFTYCSTDSDYCRSVSDVVVKGGKIANFQFSSGSDRKNMKPNEFFTVNGGTWSGNSMEFAALAGWQSDAGACYLVSFTNNTGTDVSVYPSDFKAGTADGIQISSSDDKGDFPSTGVGPNNASVCFNYPNAKITNLVMDSEVYWTDSNYDDHTTPAGAISLPTSSVTRH